MSTHCIAIATTSLSLSLAHVYLPPIMYPVSSPLLSSHPFVLLVLSCLVLSYLPQETKRSSSGSKMAAEKAAAYKVCQVRLLFVSLTTSIYTDLTSIYCPSRPHPPSIFLLDRKQMTAAMKAK